MSKIIIIAGMSRSGTSLTASLMDKAGVKMGENLLAPNHWNPRGFFEDVDFRDFHEQVMRDRGQSPFASRDFTFEPTREELEKATRLIQGREECPLWGWKYPQTSLLLDFWHELLPEAQFLFVFRHPLEVLLSYLRVASAFHFGLLELIDTWWVYNSRIKEFYERHPQSCLLCHTYAVLERTDEFFELLAGKFGLNAGASPAELRSVYHAEELRRAPFLTSAQAALRVIHPEAMQLYEDLNRRADLPLTSVDGEAPQTSDEMERLVQFATTFPHAGEAPRRRGLALLLAALTEPETTERYYAGVPKNVVWLDEQHDSWQKVAAEREKVIVELKAWIEEVERGKAWLDGQWTNWMRLANEREQTIRELNGRIEELERGRASLADRAASWLRLGKER